MDSLHRHKNRHHNLSRTPAGLDGALAHEQAASEARCRNMYTAQPDFIRWTSDKSPYLATKQNRHDLDEIPPPPLIWAFPGSATPWLRLVLEYVSGHLTGSVETDPSVVGLLRGETHGCDRGVLALHADAVDHKVSTHGHWGRSCSTISHRMSQLTGGSAQEQPDQIRLQQKSVQPA